MASLEASMSSHLPCRYIAANWTKKKDWSFNDLENTGLLSPFHVLMRGKTVVKRRKSALIVEGAALRSVYATGLLDGFVRCGFNPFDAVIGVSGGAINLACYLSRKPDIAMDIFRHVAETSALPSRILSRGSLSVFQIVNALGLRSGDFNLPENTPFYAVATDVQSGVPVYLKLGQKNLIRSIAASVSIPSVAAPVEIDGRELVDGGISDPVPVQEAIDRGYTDLMVVRARPFGYKRSDTWKHKIMRARMRRYPALVKMMRQRIERHNAIDTLIQNPPTGVKIQQICPPDDFPTRPFHASTSEIRDGYLYGLNASGGAVNEWREGFGGRQ